MEISEYCDQIKERHGVVDFDEAFSRQLDRSGRKGFGGCKAKCIFCDTAVREGEDELFFVEFTGFNDDHHVVDGVDVRGVDMAIRIAHEMCARDSDVEWVSLPNPSISDPSLFPTIVR